MMIGECPRVYMEKRSLLILEISAFFVSQLIYRCDGGRSEVGEVEKGQMGRLKG